MFRERPLLIPLFAFVAGLAISDLCGILLPVYAVAAAFCCLILSCFLRTSLAPMLGSCVFFLVWGLYALTPWKSPLPSPNSIQKYASHSPVTVEGLIWSRPVSTQTGSSFILQVTGVISG